MHRTIAGMLLCVLAITFPVYSDRKPVLTDSEVQSVLDKPLSSATLLKEKIGGYLKNMPDDVRKNVETLFTLNYDDPNAFEGFSVLGYPGNNGVDYETWVGIGTAENFGCITVVTFRRQGKKDGKLGFLMAKCSERPGYENPPGKFFSWQNPKYKNDAVLGGYFEAVQRQF